MDWSELQNWDEYTKLLIGLFALADPFGVLTVVLGLTKKHSTAEKKKIAFFSASTFIITLIIFTYLGGYILELFGITTAALQIAGGILFLFYALEMMGVIQLPLASPNEAVQDAKTIGIVPIGIPLLAGPGTISAIVIYSNFHASLAHKLLVSFVAISVGAIIYLIYRVSLTMGAKLSETTTTIMAKIMGLILATISVEFILDGIVAHFPQLISVH
jgi:multiple antibiotic resistance protein